MMAESTKGTRESAPLSTKLPERFWELSMAEQDKFIDNWIRKAWRERRELSGKPGTSRADGQQVEKIGA